jgi:hypothetical protein
MITLSGVLMITSSNALCRLKKILFSQNHICYGALKASFYILFYVQQLAGQIFPLSSLLEKDDF